MVINAPRFTVYQRQRAPLLRACPVLHSAGSGSKSLSHVRDFTLKRSFYIYRFIWLSSYCWVQLQRVIHEISTSQHTQIMSDGVGNVASDCHRMTVSFVQVCLQSLLSIPWVRNLVHHRKMTTEMTHCWLWRSRKGPQPKKCKPLEARKKQEIGHPLEPANTLILAQWNQCQTSDLQNY